MFCGNSPKVSFQQREHNMIQVTRRIFLQGLAMLGFVPAIPIAVVLATEEKPDLPVAKFGEDGYICNYAELMAGTPYTRRLRDDRWGELYWKRDYHWTRERDIWVNKEDGIYDLQNRWGRFGLREHLNHWYALPLAEWNSLLKYSLIPTNGTKWGEDVITKGGGSMQRDEADFFVKQAMNS